MKHRPILVQSLDLARNMVRVGLDLVRCPHSGAFEPSDNACNHCPQGLECEWLDRCERMVEGEEVEPSEVSATLAFAITYVANRAQDADHQRNSCKCPACSWVRRSRRLYAELQNDPQ